MSPLLPAIGDVMDLHPGPHGEGIVESIDADKGKITIRRPNRKTQTIDTHDIIAMDVSQQAKRIRAFIRHAKSFDMAVLRHKLTVYFLSLTLRNEAERKEGQHESTVASNRRCH